MDEQEYLIKEIKSLSDSIRSKSRKLKSDLMDREGFLETTFKPITAPLKELSNKLNIQSSSLEHQKLTPISKEGEEEEDYDVPSDAVSEYASVNTTTTTTNEEEEESDVNMEPEIEQPSTSAHIVTASNKISPSDISMLAQNIDSKGILTKKYVMQMLHGLPTNKNYHVYGVRLSDTGLMVGNSPVSIEPNDNIKIRGKRYKATRGLFELLFKKQPVKYSNRDLNTYKSILKLTNAHKKNYATGSPIYRNKSKKYKEIVEKLFPPRHAKSVGKGMSMLRFNEPNIIYYNDINKLVGRMQLLHEAQQAGHTGLNNEIIALTEELKERGYIE